MQKSCKHQIETGYILISVGWLISAEIYRILYEKKEYNKCIFFHHCNLDGSAYY